MREVDGKVILKSGIVAPPSLLIVEPVQASFIIVKGSPERII